MKYSLGITTTPSRGTAHNDEYPTLVHLDVDGVGVSVSRNRLIHQLYNIGAEYICIMDDDVSVMRPKWFEYAVDVMEHNSIHAIGLPNNFESRVLDAGCEMIYWSDWIGAFHIFSRRFIEEVGYFNTAYNRYGFEDSEMQHRARKSGLIGDKGMPCPIRLPFYLHAEDVYGINQTPSIPQEEKDRLIALNRPVFLQAIKDIDAGNIYYPYHQQRKGGNT